MNRGSSTINVRTASDIDPAVNRGMNFCASCTINFQTVTNSLTAISNFVPYAGSGLFLFHGLVRLYESLMDPHNIPRRWKSNPNYVLDTYRRFGNIPKRCVRKLRKGKQCLKSRKEEKINNLVKTKLNTSIIGIKSSRVGRKAKIKVHGCDKYIDAWVGVGSRGDLTLPSSCLGLLKPKLNEGE